MSLYHDIYKVVRRIPAGTVTSYGQIAKIVNCTARQVGYAMAAVSDDQNIPWHRVVNSRGEISPRKNGAGDRIQKRLLVEEGVVFNQYGRTSLESFGWTEIFLPQQFNDGPQNNIEQQKDGRSD